MHPAATTPLVAHIAYRPLPPEDTATARSGPSLMETHAFSVPDLDESILQLLQELPGAPRDTLANGTAAADIRSLACTLIALQRQFPDMLDRSGRHGRTRLEWQRPPDSFRLSQGGLGRLLKEALSGRASPSAVADENIPQQMRDGFCRIVESHVRDDADQTIADLCDGTAASAISHQAVSHWPAALLRNVLILGDWHTVDLHDADLRDRDLSGLDLKACDLSGSILIRTVLRYSMLEHANLRRADLRHCDLRNGMLARANFAGANLRNACMSNANARNAYLADASMAGAVACEADLTDAEFGGADLRNADFTNAVLDRATGLSCSGGSIFTGASVRGTSISHDAAPDDSPWHMGDLLSLFCRNVMPDQITTLRKAQFSALQTIDGHGHAECRTFALESLLAEIKTDARAEDPIGLPVWLAMPESIASAIVGKYIAERLLPPMFLKWEQAAGSNGDGIAGEGTDLQRAVFRFTENYARRIDMTVFPKIARGFARLREMDEQPEDGGPAPSDNGAPEMAGLVSAHRYSTQRYSARHANNE